MGKDGEHAGIAAFHRFLGSRGDRHRGNNRHRHLRPDRCGVRTCRAGCGPFLHIVGSVALLTGLSTTEPSPFIHEASGSYIVTTKALGRFPGFVVVWMKSFDYIVGASAVSVGFAAYFAYFLNIPASEATLVVVGSVWPILLMLLN